MFKNFKDKITISGIIVLMIGVALLIFTFISAWGFLTQGIQIPPGDFTQMFGEALGPLIATCIRIMYLGVMGWIGSLVTIRGVTLLTSAPRVEAMLVPQKPLAVQQKPAVQKVKEEKAKEEVKPPEPQMVVIPPEQVAQQQAEEKPKSEQQQASNS